MTYWLVQSNEGGQRPNTDWLSGIDKPIQCPLGHPLNFDAIDVYPSEPVSSTIACIPLRNNNKTICKGQSIVIVCESFIACIGSSTIDELFNVGSVIFPSANRKTGKLANYYSLVQKDLRQSVPLRCKNPHEFDFTFCRYCSFPSYTIRSTSDSCILASDVSTRSPVYVSISNSILVASDFVDCVKNTSQGLQFDEIEVVNAPLDNLPSELTELPGTFSHRFEFVDGRKKRRLT